MKHAAALFLLFVLCCASALDLLGSEIIITSGHRIVGKAQAEEGRLELELSPGYGGPVQLLVYGAEGVQSFEARVSPQGEVTLITDDGPVSLAELAAQAGLELAVSFTNVKESSALAVTPAVAASAEPPRLGADRARRLNAREPGGRGRSADVRPPDAELLPTLPPELPAEFTVTPPLEVPEGFAAEDVADENGAKRDKEKTKKGGTDDGAGAAGDAGEDAGEGAVEDERALHLPGRGP